MDLSFWTNIAVVFLAVETTILLTVLVVAFYFVVRGLNAAHVRLPRVLLRAQEIVHSVRTRTDDASERVVAPLVATQRTVTRAETAVQSLLTGSSQKKS
ncbi:MAG: hypothetical protein KDD83_03900 [Caldilineaceae bacterium]|nr:hypothetical protein [Caldilineaceae bacterium]